MGFDVAEAPLPVLVPGSLFAVLPPLLLIGDALLPSFAVVPLLVLLVELPVEVPAPPPLAPPAPLALPPPPLALPSVVLDVLELLAVPFAVPVLVVGTVLVGEPAPVVPVGVEPEVVVEPVVVVLVLPVGEVLVEPAEVVVPAGALVPV